MQFAMDLRYLPSGCRWVAPNWPQFRDCKWIRLIRTDLIIKWCKHKNSLAIDIVVQATATRLGQTSITFSVQVD